MAFHSSQLRLKDIYIPLTLVGNIYKPTLIDGVPIKLIREYKKILITDTAGMGKSTILKRIFIAMIDNVQENVGIPIYIELNKLHKGHLIIDEIREELKALFEKDSTQFPDADWETVYKEAKAQSVSPIVFRTAEKKLFSKDII